jgi:HK97 family phage portal protein
MGPDDPIFTDRQRVLASPQVPVQAYSVLDLQDAGLPDFLRVGNAAGACVNRRTILKNAAVYRCVTLISNSIGMLPFQLLRERDGGLKEKARDHPLFDVLASKPNSWQTAFEFRRLMQHRVLTDGNAYAMIIRSRGAVRQLVPLLPERVLMKQRDDWSVVYEVSNKSGGVRTVDPSDILHLRGPSEDGLTGLPLTQVASEVLGLSLKAQEAAARIFSQGMMAAGALETDKSLGKVAIQSLKDSLEDNYTGAGNSGKTMILEEGLKFKSIANTARDAQNVETRAHQIEEVARLFGVPRPFLMVDDTSWGTGIEQLGIFFVQYGLAPWFVAWEQAVARSLLTDQERLTLYPKFNERALLRGSMKDQSEFFSRMMGSGQSPQIMEQNEARALLDLPEHPDGSGLISGGLNGGANNGTTGQD